MFSDLDTTKFDNLCKALEAERNDISYRKPVAQTEKTETQKEREQRDATFYNAGRFIAGATDKAALKAHQELQKILARETD